MFTRPIKKMLILSTIMVSVLLTSCAEETVYLSDIEAQKENNDTNNPDTDSAGHEESYSSADIDGYNLVWSDEFDGNSLNTEIWNVEEMDPLSVNSELQRYTPLTEGNIVVNNGALHIIPKYDGPEVSEDSNEEMNYSAQKTFSTQSTVFSIDENKAETDTISLQVNFGKIADDGHFLDYEDALSSLAYVSISSISLVDISDSSYNTNLLSSSKFEKATDWSVGIISPAEGVFDFHNGIFNLKIENSGTDSWQIQLQQSGITLIPGHKYQFSIEMFSDINRICEVVLLDPQNDYDIYGSEKFLMKGDKKGTGHTISKGEITSGRLTTSGTKEFTYGRFVAKAKVPNGKGFLPAFWLLGAHSDKCAEIDIMEVMGDETNKSYHTIHYGDTYVSGHMQSQMTHVLSDSDYEDYHVFRVDWEPGLIVWYVDDEEVYRTTEWFSGTKDEQIPYPAPFNQDFFIIINLAVGGSWVGYPDYEDLNDFEGKEFVIDYVRVYQKNIDEYEKEESALK